MYIFSVFVPFLLSPLAAAASCWRDSPCTGPLETAFPGVWESYIHSPASRTVSPVSILSSTNAVLSDFPGPAVLSGNGSLLIFDFGLEVGGVITVNYAATGSGLLGLAFTEARNFTGENSDSSNGNFHTDGAVFGNVEATSDGSYTVPLAQLRGGFRYLTLFTTTSSSIAVNVTDITLEISYQPTWSNLRAYSGYFYSSDDLLNRIWYAGAYTLQTNAVPINTGRVLLGSGWSNDANLGSGESIFVDGSKRDRTDWAGDLAIALPTALIGTGDLESSKNAVQVQYANQISSTGELPFAGPPLNIYGSDTYHMSTMIGTYDYVLYSNDVAFLNSIWAQYMLAMSFITAKIDSTGLLFVTGENDWGRTTQGGHNTEANMLLYQVLVTGSIMAGWVNQPTLTTTWTALAQTLKTAINLNIWDPQVGAFKNSDTDGSIHPEDGNSLAILYGVATGANATSVSTQLTSNWGPIGAICPELLDNIVPFIEGLEIKGHFTVGETARALELIRRSWGWYLNHPDGTGSTTVEGYLSDGSFGYRSAEGYDNDPSYTSHAHGWSTGPTYALTSYVVGLTPTSPGGGNWTLAPQFGDLTHAEAGFTTGLGPFQASWSLVTGGYEVSWAVPSDTTGTLNLPVLQAGIAPTVEIDGESASSSHANGKMVVKAEGGRHTVVVRS